MRKAGGSRGGGGPQTLQPSPFPPERCLFPHHPHSHCSHLNPCQNQPQIHVHTTNHCNSVKRERSFYRDLNLELKGLKFELEIQSSQNHFSGSPK